MTRPALETVDDKLKRLRYTLTEAQAILTDVVNAARAAGVADLATTDGQGRRRTGVRMVRGTHGVSYVADRDGTDVLPAGMQAPLAATGKEHE